MSILVLGGAGYIGSHTVAALVAAGREVVVVDNLSTGHRAALPEGVKLYTIDIRDKTALLEMLEKEQVEGVIHFAANSLVGESMVNPLKYYDNNLYGTQILLEALVEKGIKAIVFSSSAATYGEPTHEGLLVEEDRTLPESCYGETKLSMEKMMKWVDRAHGLRYAAMRYFNAAGAHPDGHIGEDHGPETHLIPLILQVANGTREKISIYGTDYPTPDGTCLRDYIHVCDLAQAHILAMDYLLQGGESTVFNLGCGQGFSVRAVIEAARRVTGHPIPAEEIPRRPGDPARLVASSEKIKRVLGWKPQYENLDLILETAWRWHREHPKGFNDRG